MKLQAKLRLYIALAYGVLPLVLGIHLLATANIYMNEGYTWLQNATDCGALVPVAAAIVPPSLHSTILVILMMISIAGPIADYFVVWIWKPTAIRFVVLAGAALWQCMFCMAPINYYTRIGTVAGIMHSMQICSPDNPLPSFFRYAKMGALVPVMLLWAFVPVRVLWSLLLVKWSRRKARRPTVRFAPSSKAAPETMDDRDMETVFLRPVDDPHADDAVLD